LYDLNKYLAAGLFVTTSVRGRSADGTGRILAAKDVPKAKVDGLLPTALSRRVFVSYADRFVVLDQW
jgi:hypothetical protein